jgi:hypothetical protein
MGFGTFLASLAGPIVRRMLISLGVGVASYAALSAALNSALSHAQSSYSGLPADVLGLLGLAGVPDALAIICGGLVARASLLAVKRLAVLS